MEGTALSHVIARAQPDLGFRRNIRVAATGASIALLGVTAVVLVSTGIAFPLGVLLCAALGVLGATFSRGDLAEVRVTPTGLDVVGHDGLVRAIPGWAIGSMGINGTVVAGRLFTTNLGFLPGTNGRLVVQDREGRVLCARRAGWMRVDDIAALAAAGGVPFVGTVVLAVPGATLPPPTDLAPPPPGRPGDDPATIAAIESGRRRQRAAWAVVLALVPVAIGAFVLQAHLDGAGRTPVFGVIGVLAVLLVLFGAPVVALCGDHVRQARAVIRRAPGWYLVEAVVATGLAADTSARTVGVIDPATGETDFFTVRGGGEKGWLQGDDRTWFWFAPARRGKKAVIAPPDRSQLALLEQKFLTALTRRAARDQVRSEHQRWEDRQAWAMWAAPHPPAPVAPPGHR